jgi:hypothetical protein
MIEGKEDTATIMLEEDSKGADLEALADVGVMVDINNRYVEMMTMIHLIPPICLGVTQVFRGKYLLSLKPSSSHNLHSKLYYSSFNNNNELWLLRTKESLSPRERPLSHLNNNQC